MSPHSISIDARHPHRPRAMDQIDALAIDLVRLCAEGDSPGRGIAFAAAHAALRLAVTPAVGEDERMIKQEALADAAHALACVGLGHLVELIAAAEPFDVLAGCLQRGNELVQ